MAVATGSWTMAAVSQGSRPLVHQVLAQGRCTARLMCLLLNACWTVLNRRVWPASVLGQMTAKACAPSRACHGSSWAWCMQRWTLLATWATNGPALPRAAPVMAAMWKLLTKSLSVLCGVWPLCVRRALYRWARAAGLSSFSVTKLSVAGFCLLLWARILPFRVDLDLA